MIDNLAFGALLADKGFDIDWIRTEMAARWAQAVIPSKADRRQPIPCDFAMYRWRHLVENLFCALKGFRRTASRYDQTDTGFGVAIYLAAAFLALK